MSSRLFAARRLTRLRNYFLTGLIVTGPLAITVYLVWSFVQWADGWIVPLVPQVYNPGTYLPFHVPGFGIAVGAFVATAIGFLAAGYAGRRVVAFGERMLGRMPVVRNLYNGLKQMIQTVLSSEGGVFQQAALIEYPRKGVWAIALVAPAAAAEIAEHLKSDRAGIISVFVPTTPNPTTGFLTYVSRQEIMPLDMSIEDAVKTIISSGLVTPHAKGADDRSLPQKAA
jgi:uncharacterized membrane protein